MFPIITLINRRLHGLRYHQLWMGFTVRMRSFARHVRKMTRIWHQAERRFWKYWCSM